MTYDNPWIYKGEVFDSEDINEYYGFVYLIENITNGRKYIGKKFFWNKKTLPPLKGKKRKRRKLVESDWKQYYGSSNELLSDIEKIGIDKFNRNIIHLCNNKTECAYMELKEQVEREVLLTEDYYNNFIGVKIGGRNLLK